MKIRINVLVTALAALAPAFAAEGDAAPEPIFSNRLTNTFMPDNVADPRAVAKASLYATADDGATWTLVQEIAVPEGAKELPRFPLTVAKDGRYGIMTCVTYRNGQSPDLPPRPGQPPGTVLYVDTVSPVLARFDAQLMGVEKELARVALAWSVADPNLDAEPALIEASVDGGHHFTIIHRGPAQGTATVSVPLPAAATNLFVMLVATDLAGNAAESPFRSLSLSRAVAPANAMEELALAAKTLPTPAELGLTPPPPLPIWPALTESVPEPETAPAPVTAPSAPATAPKAAPPAWPALAEASPPVLKPSAPVAKTAPVATAPAPSAPAAAPKAASPASSASPAWPALVEVPPSAPKPSTPTPPSASAVTDTVREAPIEPVHEAPIEPADSTAPPRPEVDQAPRPRPAARPKKPEIPAAPPRSAAAKPPPSPPAAAKPSAPIDGERSPTLSQRFIGGSVAQQHLQDARVSVRLGRLDDACDIYEQLLSSDQSWTACAEEAALLNRLGRPRDALAVTNAFPSDKLPDAARIEQGKALMTLKRHGEALGGLSRVNGNGPHGRMALLLIARCLMAEGKTEFGAKVLKRLSLGKDDIAAAARGELGMASR